MKTEREQLIENIVATEVISHRRELRLLDKDVPEDEKKQLEAWLANDRKIVAQWMTDFKISNDEVRAVRAGLLASSKEDSVKLSKRTIDEIRENAKQQIAGAKREEKLRLKVADELLDMDFTFK